MMPWSWCAALVLLGAAAVASGMEAATRSKTSILVEGWSKWLTSYSLVNRHQLLHLYKHFEKTFSKEVKPFLPSWQALPPVASLNGTAVVTDRALVRDGQYDAVFRIQFPIDITPAARPVPVFLFYTAEYAAIEDPHRYVPYDSFEAFVGKCKAGEIYPVTPSQWSAQALVRHGVTPLVVPHGVDLSLHRPRARPADVRAGLGIPADDAFVFLNIGNFVDTKCAPELIAAFFELSLAHDDVYLVMKGITTKTYPNTRSPEWLMAQAKEVYLKAHAGDAKKARQLERVDVTRVVFVIDDDMPDSDVADLYLSADCYVSPYRGEGFNLPVLEAMATGLPVVVTAGGSTDDFIYPPSAVTIPSRVVERYAGRGDDRATRVYNPLQLEVTHRDIVRALSKVKKGHAEYADHATSPGAMAHVATYTWANVTATLADAIKGALAQRPAGATAPQRETKQKKAGVEKKVAKEEAAARPKAPPKAPPAPETTHKGKGAAAAGSTTASTTPTATASKPAAAAAAPAPAPARRGATLRRLAVEGWTKWLTSYCLVNRNQLAHMAAHVDVLYYREVKPFLSNWQTLPPLPHMDALTTGKKADAATDMDAVFRIHYPYNSKPALPRAAAKAREKSGAAPVPVFMFYTAEYAGLDTRHFMPGSSSVEMRERCRNGEIIPVTPSHWSARALLDPPCVPIVVPHGVNSTLFHMRARRPAFNEVRDVLGIPQKAFVFLNIGSLLGTKSIPELLMAFLDMCHGGREAYLVLKGLSNKSYPNVRTPEFLIDVVKNAVISGGGAWSEYEGFVDNIVFVIDDDMPPNEIADLYHMADCYVSPYKGEGFNLPVLEAMATGLPVVVTAGGSTDDFIYPPSAVTIPSREVSMRDYPGGANEDGTVLVAEQLDIVQSMEHAMRDRKALTAAARSPGARAHLEQFTWAAVTERLMEELGRAVAGTRGEHVAEAQRPGKKAKAPPAPRTRAVEDEEEEDDEEEDEKEEKKGSDVTYDGWTKVIPAHSATSSIKVLSDLAALTSDGRGPRAAQATQRHGATGGSAPPGQGAKKAAKGGSVGSGGSGGSGNGPKKAKPHTPPARTKARRRRKRRPHAAVAAATDEL